jgi:hypothetical protein
MRTQGKKLTLLAGVALVGVLAGEAWVCFQFM